MENLLQNFMGSICVLYEFPNANARKRLPFFHNYLNRMRGGGGGGGQKMSVFVHAQGMKTVHTGRGGGQKWAKFCPRSC